MPWLSLIVFVNNVCLPNAPFRHLNVWLLKTFNTFTTKSLNMQNVPVKSDSIIIVQLSVWKSCYLSFVENEVASLINTLLSHRDKIKLMFSWYFLCLQRDICPWKTCELKQSIWDDLRRPLDRKFHCVVLFTACLVKKEGKSLNSSHVQNRNLSIVCDIVFCRLSRPRRTQHTPCFYECSELLQCFFNLHYLA